VEVSQARLLRRAYVPPFHDLVILPYQGLDANHGLFFSYPPALPYCDAGFLQEITMTLIKALRRVGVFAAAALLVTAVSMKPVTVYAMGTDSPPPADDGSKKKKKKKDNNVIEQQQQQQAQEKFLRDYRDARQLILDGKYEAGIAAMHALGHDEHPDVANYIGYANRKMGDYEQSKIWYEAALKADPNHVRTWSYYGMWQMEQGNRLKALEDLQKVQLICGNTNCEEYRQLKDVIDGKATY
jgi:tetratricopeptide (TPR) repeat protein